MVQHQKSLSNCFIKTYIMQANKLTHRDSSLILGRDMGSFGGTIY